VDIAHGRLYAIVPGYVLQREEGAEAQSDPGGQHTLLMYSAVHQSVKAPSWCGHSTARMSMSDWLAHLLRSLADQAGTWFVGIILALLGAFSGRLVETIKFSLNRADLRTKYYEQMALEISQFVFIVDRLSKVYYGSNWASAEDNDIIANEYNEVMHEISRKEYVYLSWLQHYWGKGMTDAFVVTMERIRAVDAILIRLNERGDKKDELGELAASFRELQQAARFLLVSTA
jgi:hypothetical protein